MPWIPCNPERIPCNPETIGGVEKHIKSDGKESSVRLGHDAAGYFVTSIWRFGHNAALQRFPTAEAAKLAYELGLRVPIQKPIAGTGIEMENP